MTDPLLIVMQRELQAISKSVAQLNKHHLEKLSDEFVRKEEVLKMLGISTRTLHKLTSSGTLPYVKIGGLLFFKVEEINRMLQDNYISHTTKSNLTTFKTKNND